MKKIDRTRFSSLLMIAIFALIMNSIDISASEIDVNLFGDAMSSSVHRQARPEEAASNPLRSTHFTNMTDSAGLAYYGIGEGVAWGDCDGDLDLDLFVSNLGSDLLYENQGDGSFIEVAYSRGVSDGGYGRGTAWADYDNDGDLDNFLLRDSTNRLYENDGLGFFTDVAADAGIVDNVFQRGMAWGDFDNDGLIDLYLSSVDGLNYLYRNLDGNNFEDVASVTGVSNADGTEGTAWGDFDNDGLMDLYVTSKYDLNTIYRNLGDGTFEDVTDQAGARGFGVAYGVAWADYDNDLDLDLYVTTKGTRNFLFMNNGDGTFTDVTESAGVEESNQATGIAWGDYDNDCYIDLYVLGDPGPNILYHNNGNGTFSDITE